MTTLDDLRLRVVPGDGVVLRAPGVTAVAFPSSDQHQDLVTAFIDAARAAAGQPDAGRKAARAVAGLLAAADDAPPLGLVGTDGAGLAVLLHADVEFAFRDAAGVDQTLSGRDAAAWLDRLLDTVPEQWSLARDGAGAADEWSDFQAGVARGNGVATGTPAPAPETAAEAPVPPVDLEPEQTPAGQVDVAPPPPPPKVTTAPVPAADFVSVSLLDEEPDGESVRAPLPLAGADEPPPPPEPDEPEVPHVHGVICARGHFNDPTSPFCASCGISMVQQTHNLVEGPRPPLGVLVLDDGSTYVVDRDIVVGREPDTDPAVAAGDVRGIALPDPERAISRVHARVTLQGWDVLISDAGSANGTFVARRDATQWTPIQPDSPVALTPGMHVLVGPRVLSFDSHRRS
ncbi:MAG: FHA domain-containing protein [Acidimicrobiales bacterium]